MQGEMVLPPVPPNMTYRIEKLNPLAFPKGMDLRCELTGKPALVRPHGQRVKARSSPRGRPCPRPRTAPAANPLAPVPYRPEPLPCRHRRELVLLTPLRAVTSNRQVSLVSPFLSIHFASRELATHAWEGALLHVETAPSCQRQRGSPP